MEKSYPKAALLISAAFLLQACSHDDTLSCDPPEKTGISVGFQSYVTEPGARYTADIFVFNDDNLQRLDSYQRLILENRYVPVTASQKGSKIIAAILNPHSDTYDWPLISSFRSFMEMKTGMDQESGFSPLMSGYCRAEAGKDAKCEIRLEPLGSRIELRSVRCDFAGKPYAGSRLDNVKAYLVNVSSETGVFQESGFSPESFFNQGLLAENDMESFRYPETVCREIEGSIGNTAVSPKISFYCYPNECKEESRFTRLVIEGRLNGRICYYPININRDTWNSGISRNRCYVYDVTIRTTGTSDPNTAITPMDAYITCNIVPWNEKENTGVIF